MTDTTIHLKSSQAAETRVEVETNKQKFPALSKRLEAARSFCVEVQQGVSKLQCKRKAHKVFSVKTLKNKLPILKWLPQYRLADLRGDLIAGLTLGLTVIPQSLAYARIAELPTQYGLYTSFMCYFVYCFMGTARDVNIGPAAVMSLLTAEFTHQIPQLAALLSLICGVSQLLMGLLNIGFIMEFISHTIINSFTTAAALAILFSQVKRWLGLQGVPRDFMRQLYYSIVKIPETQIFDFLMGLVCMLILFLLKKAKSMRLAKEASPALVSFLQFISTARNAITIFLASVFSAILYYQRIEPFTLTGNITSGVPPLHLPTLTVHLPDNTTLAGTDTFKMVGIGSVIAPLVGLIEVIAIAKAFGKKNGYKVDSTQEFISLGVSNILGSFVSAYPVTGSFSRSAVAAQSGIRTPAANIVTGILVLVALAFLTPIFFFIPTPALAAVIIMAVTDLIDFSMLHQLWTINKADLVPWFVTFFVSLLFGFEYGILLGVAVSLLFLIYPWTKSTIKIHPVEARFADLDNFQDIGAQKRARVVVVEPTFGLLFPGAEVFEERIFKHVTTGDCIIIDFNHIWKLDYSAATTLSHLAKDLAHKNIKYVFINLHEKVERKLPKVEKAGSLKSAIDFLRGKMEEENIEDADFKETNASNILEVSVECEVKTTSLGGAFDRQEMKEKNEADKEDEQKNDRMGDQAMEVRDPSVAPSKPSEAPSKPSEAPSKPPEASRESYEAFRGFEGAVESKPFLPK